MDCDWPGNFGLVPWRRIQTTSGVRRAASLPLVFGN